MNFKPIFLILSITLFLCSCNNKEKVKLSGDLLTWHRITLDIPGPYADEQDLPNPFLDYRLIVDFKKDDNQYRVPGYFAADGNASKTGATAGNVWRVNFSPDSPGTWTYEIHFHKGKKIALSNDMNLGVPLETNGVIGEIEVEPSDKTGKDFRSVGRLIVTDGHYLKYKGSGDYFLKGGADSPENFLAYIDFDGTYYGGNNQKRAGEDAPNLGLHSYSPHVNDWKEGDPVWQGSKGKGIIGALNYLSSKGMNSVYFLTMNILGDGEDVWPYTDRDERYRFDCSKLDQWEIVFSHMDKLGIMLHVVLQETENECLLDAGYLDVQRKLYLRELVARFSHHLGITWNLGEEHNPASWSPYGQTVEDTKKMASYLREKDPYDHFINVHSHGGEPDRSFYISQYLGFEDINGPSIQVGNPFDSHQETLKWLKKSSETGHNWVVCIDEIGQHWKGALPDDVDPGHDTIRHNVLWANLMAGGGGVEWYFGYQYPHGDLNCEDWRSRNNLWEQTAYAIKFFHEYLPFQEMKSRDELVSAGYCFAKQGEVYAVYFPPLADKRIDLRDSPGEFIINWYNPRTGEGLLTGSKEELEAGSSVNLGDPPGDPGKDWVCLITRK